MAAGDLPATTLTFLRGAAGAPLPALRIGPPDATSIRGTVLFVQPPGDDQPAGRRFAVRVARHFATLGWASVIADPSGTGDGPGWIAADGGLVVDDPDADVDADTDAPLPPRLDALDVWRGDLLTAAAWVRRMSDGPFVLIGLRAGARLANDLALALDQLADGLVLLEVPLEAEASGTGLPATLARALAALPVTPRPLGERGVAPWLLVAQSARDGAMPSEIEAAVESWMAIGSLASLHGLLQPDWWRDAASSDAGAALDAIELFLGALAGDATHGDAR